jgi:hypothetical protein
MWEVVQVRYCVGDNNVLICHDSRLFVPHGCNSFHTCFDIVLCECNDQFLSKGWATVTFIFMFTMINHTQVLDILLVPMSLW